MSDDCPNCGWPGAIRSGHTAVLHERIRALEARVKEVEAALADARMLLAASLTIDGETMEHTYAVERFLSEAGMEPTEYPCPHCSGASGGTVRKVGEKTWDCNTCARSFVDNGEGRWRSLFDAGAYDEYLYDAPNAAAERESGETPDQRSARNLSAAERHVSKYCSVCNRPVCDDCEAHPDHSKPEALLQ